MKDSFSITVDIDWAPDHCIQSMAQLFIDNSIKCTWFVTHDSPAIRALRNRPDLFELGIHPNFFSGSTHGTTEKDILDHIFNIVPEAKSVRTHALYQSSRLLNLMCGKYGITTDCSMLLYKTNGISPHSIRFSHDTPPLFRIPFYWEDDIAMYDEENKWDLNKQSLSQPGLKVFNFHPVFVYLNGSSMAPYEEMKKIGPLQQLNESQMVPFINKNNGCGTFLKELVKHLVNTGEKTYTMAELTRCFQLADPSNEKSGA